MNMEKYEQWKLKNRRENLLVATDKIQEWVTGNKILSLELIINRKWGEDEDPLVVDYSVDLVDGTNISDLSFDTIEEALLDISKELHEKDSHDK